MSSAGFPILVVGVLLAGTAAAIVITPRDLLRTSVVTAPSPFLKADEAVALPRLPEPPADLPVIQVASMTVEVTPLGDPMALGAAPVSMAPPVPAVEEPEADLRRITAAALNMRGAPDKTSELLATLPRDTLVSVLETSGSWARVAAPDGTVGWLSQKFLVAAE